MSRPEKEILELLRQHQIETVVVGLPLDEQGQKTSQCLKIENFCSRLEQRASIRIVFVDEYCSSVEAEHRLSEAGKKRKLRSKKDMIDAGAAAIILQNHLDQMSYQEIAEIMDLPKGTVKSYLFRGRKKLKDLLVLELEGEEI